MKKIFLVPLLLIGGIAVSMHTSVQAMNKQAELAIITIDNKADKEAVVFYERGDHEVETKTVGAGKTATIKQKAWDPIHNMWINFRGDNADNSKELTPDETVDLLATSKTLEINSASKDGKTVLTYNII